MKKSNKNGQAEQLAFDLGQQIKPAAATGFGGRQKINGNGPRASRAPSPDMACSVESPGRQDIVRRPLNIGSDVEIANRVRIDLTERWGEIVHDDGAFWRYSGTHWEIFSQPSCASLFTSMTARIMQRPRARRPASSSAGAVWTPS